MFQADKSLITAKIESPYGTDPTPAVATESLIVKGEPAFEVLGSSRSREVAMPFFGRLKGVNVGDGLKIAFTTELKHSGVAATPSRYGPLFRACNMTETINGNVIYVLNSTLGGDSITIWFYIGGVLHKINGARGTFKLNMKAGEICTVDWEFTGLYADNAADIAQPAATHETIAPIICNQLGFTYSSWGGVIEELMLDIGNVVSLQKDVNAANNGVGQYFISNRESKGSMNPEAVALGTLNPWDIWDQTTAANIALDITASAGNDFGITVTGANIEIPKYGNRENVLTWELGFNINPTISTGNNEIEITFK